MTTPTACDSCSPPERLCDCCRYYDRPGFIWNAGAWMRCPECNRTYVPDPPGITIERCTIEVQDGHLWLVLGRCADTGTAIEAEEARLRAAGEKRDLWVRNPSGRRDRI